MQFVKKYWWKIITVILMSWVIVGGLVYPIPDLPVLNESARNLFFHVPMWYVMLICFFTSTVYAVLYLNNPKEHYDAISLSLIKVGLLFGVMGLTTGMLWASGTWGSPWNNDPKQVGSALTLLTYAAYLVLRNTVRDKNKAPKLAAVYNVFALALIIPLLYIIPSRLEGLHPGSVEDDVLAAMKGQASSFKAVSLPAFLGWVMLGLWIFDIRYRIEKLIMKRNEI